MCSNAEKSIGAVMTETEPLLVNLLTDLGIASTPDGEAAIAAFKAAATACENWVPGTTAQDAIEAINAFTAVFNVLPIPTEAKTLADVITAAVEIVIGTLTGNSPAPAGGTVTAEAQKAHEVATADSTEARVKVLIPEYTLSPIARGKIFLGGHAVIAGEIGKVWNNRCEKLGGKYLNLKTA